MPKVQCKFLFLFPKPIDQAIFLSGLFSQSRDLLLQLNIVFIDLVIGQTQLLKGNEQLEDFRLVSRFAFLFRV